MIKNYCIIYEKFNWDESCNYEISQHEIVIPAQNLFDAIHYCHNILEIKNIKKVYEL